MSNWKCEICGQVDPRLMFILPLRQANGNLNTMACEACAEKSKAYCRKHGCQHIGFLDGSTVCMLCIEELVALKENEATSIRDRLLQGLTQDEKEDLEDAVSLSSGLTQSSESVTVLRFIASKALRANRTIEDIICDIAVSREHRLNYIFL